MRPGSRLTRIERRSAPLREHPPAEPDSRPRSVLVLEADPRTRARAEEVLSTAGYRSASTGDAPTAERMAGDSQADLLLVDVAMGILQPVPRWARRQSDPPPVEGPSPIPDGYALLCPFVRDPRAATFAAVVLGPATPGERGAPVRFGVLGYIEKPLRRDHLLERLETTFVWLERGPAGPAAPGAEATAAAEAAEAADAVPRGPAPGFAALVKEMRRAVLVDPDPDARRRLRRLLEPHEFTVYEGSDGQEGLGLVVTRRPWLVITEVNMPGLDGFELCRIVRAQSITRRIPLVFHSSWGDYGERFLGFKLGGDDYLVKGTPAREMLIRLQLVLHRFADLGVRTSRGTGLEGELELIGMPGLLQMCHVSRFTGTCTMRREGERARVVFSLGELVSAECGAARDEEAVFALMAWTRGHFEFVPGSPGPDRPLRESFEFLLLEGCRRLDEQGRGVA